MEEYIILTLEKAIKYALTMRGILTISVDPVGLKNLILIGMAIQKDITTVKGICKVCNGTGQIPI